MEKTQRKRIGGVPHKRIPCTGCGEMIWVHYQSRKSIAVCSECTRNVRGFDGQSSADSGGRGDAPERSE